MDRNTSLKKKSLAQLLTELADKNTSTQRQRWILNKINASLALDGHKISQDYISNFYANGRSKLAIFYDICNLNNIEPTSEICKKLVGSDEPKFRKEWAKSHVQTSDINNNLSNVYTYKEDINISNEPLTVYLSQLLKEKFPLCCDRLIAIFEKHNVRYAFLQGTKDIWCRDYMPVKSASGKLVQFKYEPSYLNDYADLRSDVKYVCEANNINPIFSDINLDGGNVIMLGRKAIITDRVFTENPDASKDDIRKKLADLLEAEIIIIPAYGKSIDFTGHADGMIRFINSETVLLNDISNDSPSWQERMKRALRLANLNYISMPYFEMNDKTYPNSAVGIYLNYLEVGNLIVAPIFGSEGNKDAEALAILRKVFPNKTIETIDYTEVAQQGGLLNCTTWIY